METKFKYVCIKCGDCCRTFEMFLDDSKDNNDSKKQIQETVASTIGIKYKKIENISVKVYAECKNLKDNMCVAYLERPERCRKFMCNRYFIKENNEGKNDSGKA